MTLPHLDVVAELDALRSLLFLPERAALPPQSPRYDQKPVNCLQPPHETLPIENAACGLIACVSWLEDVASLQRPLRRLAMVYLNTRSSRMWRSFEDEFFDQYCPASNMKLCFPLSNEGFVCDVNGASRSTFSRNECGRASQKLGQTECAKRVYAGPEAGLREDEE